MADLTGDLDFNRPQKPVRARKRPQKHTTARTALIRQVDAFLKGLSPIERGKVEQWIDRGGDMWIEVKFS